jgi:hypothetical protein
MPFIYDESNIEWPEDDDEWEPPPPRADQFVYLSPPEYGGAREPVPFSVEEPPPPPAEPAPERGKWPLSAEERVRLRKWDEWRRQEAFALAVLALRKAGVRRLYCRYDGGNDEGFSRLYGAEMTDGTRLDAKTICGRLIDAGLLDRIHAGGIEMPPSAEMSARFADWELLRRFFDDWLVGIWATMLLGDGYGTGEHSMYGAFTVDLEACTITDDRDADPVVENIQIAT